jgi:hypothetical protein
MALPVASELGTIRSLDGWSYRITPDDLLWLARSVEYEGGDPVATAWTYAQRLASFRSSSLAALVRAHSQPVNPDWASLDAPGCVRAPERCHPRQRADGTWTRDPLEVRAEARTAPWSSLSVGPMLARWAQASVPNPVPRATDFADAEVSSSFLRRHPDARVVKRSGNWYLSEGPSSAPARPSNAWPANFVSIAYGSRVATAAAAGLGLVGFGVVAFLAWRAVASVKWLGRR